MPQAHRFQTTTLHSGGARSMPAVRITEAGRAALVVKEGKQT